jgi:hypothetical protein
MGLKVPYKSCGMTLGVYTPNKWGALPHLKTGHTTRFLLVPPHPSPFPFEVADIVYPIRLGQRTHLYHQRFAT